MYEHEIEYPFDALERIFLFSNLIRPFVQKNAADFGCGSEQILRRFFPYISSYDYFIHNDNVDFIDLLDSESVPIQKHDTVVMAHVLEHFDDPMIVLDNVRRGLNSGGNVIVAVPDARFNDKYKPYDLDIGHRYQFAPESLKHTMVSSGFNIKFFAEVTHDIDHHELICVGELSK